MNSEIYPNNIYPNASENNVHTPYYNDTLNDVRKNTYLGSNHIQDLLKLVVPVKANFFMTFPGSKDWPDKKFSGIIEMVGNDHVILSDPSTGNSYLLPNIYLNYIEFEEDLKKYLKK